MSLDKTIGHRNEKEEQVINDLNSLFNIIKTFVYYSKITLTENDLNCLVEGIGMLEFKVLLKFAGKHISEEATKKMINIFITFVNRILQTHNKSTLNEMQQGAMRYEKYLEGLQYLEFSLPFGKEVTVTEYPITMKDGYITCGKKTYGRYDGNYELTELYNKFRAKADECLANYKEAYEEIKILNSTELIKADFKNEMLNLCKFYNIKAKQEIEKAGLANEIERYFKENNS